MKHLVNRCDGELRNEPNVRCEIGKDPVIAYDMISGYISRSRKRELFA